MAQGMGSVLVLPPFRPGGLAACWRLFLLVSWRVRFMENEAFNRAGPLTGGCDYLCSASQFFPHKLPFLSL